jgi:hypothetical protein
MADVEEDAVALVRLSTPNVDPVPTSNISPFTMNSTPNCTHIENCIVVEEPMPSTNLNAWMTSPMEHAPTPAMPTPKSSIEGDESPAPRESNPTEEISPSKPEAPPSEDLCMICTPETAPEVPEGATVQWIECSGCKRWCHILCCPELPKDCDPKSIKDFYCKRCARPPLRVTTCTSLLIELT